ncbi:MAG: polyprenyl synthetase family protein [Myxococcota bacterium]
MLSTFNEAREVLGPHVAAGLEAAIDLAIEEAHLSDMIRTHLASGGKRLRALVPLWIHLNRGGELDDVLPMAAGIELLHNATLVHDDLQDGDTHRRGQPTTWQRYGEAQAINTGDALYFAGMTSLLLAPAGHRVAGAVAKAMTRVIEGQVREFRLQDAPSSASHLAPGLAAWTTMARGKTGALFGAAFRVGFAAGTQDVSALDAAEAQGQSLGWAFQVQDDLLDLVGDKGRERGATDLAEGKLSYPAVWALEHGAEKLAKRLLLILRTPREETTDAMLDEGLGLLEECGALQAAVNELRDAKESYAGSPCAALMPDLMDVVLRPVAHVLN